jgi:hypothetical protein
MKLINADFARFPALRWRNPLAQPDTGKEFRIPEGCEEMSRG